MKLKLNLLALSFLSCTAMYAQTTEPAAQNDWANTLRYEKANQELTQKPYAVFMGNSITDNWSNRTHPEFFTEHNFVGRGISGQTSAEMLVRFRKDVIELDPEVVVILAGTNDMALNNGYISYENVVRNIASMCDLAKAHKIKVALCSVTPSTTFCWRPEIDARNKIVELNKHIKAYADEHKILYVDYHSALKDENNGFRSELTKDGCHPEMPGYAIMEKIILEQIGKAKVPR